MSAVTKSNNKSIIIVGGILAVIGISLFAYLTWYTAPDQVLERVTVIAVTEQGCIAETYDGHPVNIGPCDAEPGEYVQAYVDQKTKERSKSMNPEK